MRDEACSSDSDVHFLFCPDSMFCMLMSWLIPDDHLQVNIRSYIFSNIVDVFSKATATPELRQTITLEGSFEGDAILLDEIHTKFLDAIENSVGNLFQTSRSARKMGRDSQTKKISPAWNGVNTTHTYAEKFRLTSNPSVRFFYWSHSACQILLPNPWLKCFKSLLRYSTPRIGKLISSGSRLLFISTLRLPDLTPIFSKVPPDFNTKFQGAKWTPRACMYTACRI